MKHRIMIAVLLISCINAFAQDNIKTYSGETKTPKGIKGKLLGSVSKGEVTYSYYELNDEERVKHGKLEFIYFYSINKYSVAGHYKSGKKEGIWTMTEYIDINMLNKKEREYQETDKFIVTYKDDILDGPFKGILKGVVNSSGSLKDGHYIGEIRMEAPDCDGMLIGVFNESGWAHGKWKIERKKGIPVKQEREYYEGFLLKVVESDLASGEKTVLFELPEETVNDIKNTFNIENSTLTVKDKHYKRAQLARSNNDVDSRIVKNKSVSDIFNGIYGQTMSDFITFINGFAQMEYDSDWYRAEERERARLAKEKEAKQEAERQANEQIINEMKQIEKIHQEELAICKSKIGKNHVHIRNIASDKKQNIYYAYIKVYDKMKNDPENEKTENLIKNAEHLIKIQEIVIQLMNNKKTKKVEKIIVDISGLKNLLSFFENDALSLCE